MLVTILVGAAMIFATTLVHASFMVVGVATLRRHVPEHRAPLAGWRPGLVLSLFVLWMFLAGVVEAWCWAALYLLLGVFETVEAASYFSIVTFSTLGYGDIVLASPFRLLASVQAFNGLILFGWTTALVFAVVQQLYTEHRGPAAT